MRNENERFVEMGKRIRARRLSLKMKQMELAEKVDISNNHISSIERGIGVLDWIHLSESVMYWMLLRIIFCLVQ